MVVLDIVARLIRILEWHHHDLADRVIVATATRLDCPLVSSYPVIGEFYAATLW